MSSLRAILRRGEAALLAADETPHQASLALAFGVFLSFSPLVGFQILLATLIALSVRINRVLLFIGLCSNLPWLAPPYYAFTTEAAAWAMGVVPPSRLADDFAGLFAHSVLSGAFWSGLLLLVRPLFWPFVIGSFLAAGVLALVAYSLGFALASARRSRRREH